MAAPVLPDLPPEFVEEESEVPPDLPVQTYLPLIALLELSFWKAEQLYWPEVCTVTAPLTWDSNGSVTLEMLESSGLIWFSGEHEYLLSKTSAKVKSASDDLEIWKSIDLIQFGVIGNQKRSIGRFCWREGNVG